MYAKRLKTHCPKPCSAKSRNNVISRLLNSLIFMMLRLLFHETIKVNEAQVPPTGLLCEV